MSVAADSAYDKEAVYEAIEAHSPGRRTRVVIPPQRNATLSQNSNTAMLERDRHIRAIERHGRREWYKLSGYSKRSMAENAVYRYKAIIGPEMQARTLARQRVENRIGCEILNKLGCARDARYVLRRVTLQPAQGGQRFAPGRATTPLTDDERHRLAVKGKALGRKLLAEVVGIVTPETNRLPSCAKTRTATVSPSAGLRPFGPVANTDTKLLIYGLFQKSRVLAQDGGNCKAQGALGPVAKLLIYGLFRKGRVEWHRTGSPRKPIHRLGCNKRVQIAKRPGGRKWQARSPPHGRCSRRPRDGRRASVRPLRTSSPMASKSPWTPASKFSLNSTVLTVETGETEPTAALPAVSASRLMRPPWMTPCPSSNSARKGKRTRATPFSQ